MMITRFVFTLLVGLVVSLGALVSGGPVLANVLPDVSPEEQYRFSLGRALANDLVTAEAAFDEFRKVNKGHERLVDATFWLGRVQFMRGEYEKAAMTFSEFNSTFPRDSRLGDTTLWIAESVSHFAPREQACEIYASLPKLLDNPPSSFMNQLGALASAAKCGETAIASSKRTPKQARIKNASSFEDDLSLIGKNRLCSFIRGFQHGNTGSASHHSYRTTRSLVEFNTELKRRGVKCQDGFAVAIDKRSLIDKRLSKIKDEDICEYASYLTGTAGGYISNWSVVEYSQQYVREAKRRGLSCGVGKKTSRTETASAIVLEIGKARATCNELGFSLGTKKYENCVSRLSGKPILNQESENSLLTKSDQWICKIATTQVWVNDKGKIYPYSTAGFKTNTMVWNWANYARSAFNEAKRRKLDCGVTKNPDILREAQRIANNIETSANPSFQQNTGEAERLRQRVAALEAEKAKQQQVVSSDTQVPLITITQSGADGRKGSVKGYAKDNVQVAEVLIDGQAVRVGNDGSFEWSGFVPSTGKQITIEAIDTAALSSTKTVSLKRGQIQQASGPRFDVLDPTAGKKVKRNSNALALIVGISDYERTDAPAVYADKDAQYFHDYASLKLGISDSNIKTMVNAKAEQGDVILAVKDWMRRSSKPGKTDVYVFFAGHGLASDDGEQMYLLPYDGRPRLLDDTAILRDRLFTDIASANPRSVTVFLDTCYSGTTRGTDMLIASRPIAIKALEQSIPDNFTVMTAAAGDQTAKPLEEAKHGMFSYFLMKGMEGEADKNQDNKITAGELHSYVQSNVIQQSSGSQTPELQGDAERVLVRFQ